MSRRVRLAFWLFVMDVLAFAGLFGSRPYFWAVGRAANCEDYWRAP